MNIQSAEPEEGATTVTGPIGRDLTFASFRDARARFLADRRAEVEVARLRAMWALPARLPREGS